MTDDKPTPTPRQKMLGEYYARELAKRIALARQRTPAGLAKLFPGLGSRKRK